MRVLYRADGGHPIGTGHIFRALRILERLAEEEQVSATLVVGNTAAARVMVDSSPYDVVYAPPSFGPDSVKPQFAFDSVERLLRERSYDLAVVDMLDTPARDMELLRAAVNRVVTFDDRGDGRVFADTIINVLVTEPEPETLPKEIRLYEGPEFPVVDGIYAGHNGAYRFDPVGSGRVFVTLGGGDAAGLSVKVARALRSVRGVETVAFGLGPAFLHRQALNQVVESASWESHIFTNLPNLRDQYLACDLAVIAGGLTMYEACCVGVPSLAVCQPIDHQLELAQRLADEGAMTTVGYGEATSEEEISSAIADLMEHRERRKSMSEIGPKLVDGRGGERVARILMEVGASSE